MKITRLLLGAWFPIALLVLWELLPSSIFFPAPLSILERFLSEGASLDWWVKYPGATIAVFGSGYLAGLLLGLVMGGMLGLGTRLYSAVTPILVFYQKMPSAAKLPLFLAILGLGVGIQVLIVAIAVALYMTLASSKATRHPTPQRADTAMLFKLTRFQSAYLVHLPGKLHVLVTTAKSALQLAFILTILGETLGATSGLGSLLVTSKTLFDMELMWISIFLSGLIGFTLQTSFEFLEKRVFRIVER